MDGDIVSRLWALKGGTTGQALTLNSRIVVHDNRHELEWLFPNTEVVDVTNTHMPVMRLKDHPDMSAVTWPLKKEDFR